MKIQIKNGRLIDPKNGVDAVQDLFIATGRIRGIGKAPANFQQIGRYSGCKDQGWGRRV